MLFCSFEEAKKNKVSAFLYYNKIIIFIIWSQRLIDYELRFGVKKGEKKSWILSKAPDGSQAFVTFCGFVKNETIEFVSQ